MKAPSEMKGKKVEEILRDWSKELEQRCAAFQRQAEAMAEWDRRILSNRNVIVALEVGGKTGLGWHGLGQARSLVTVCGGGRARWPR